MEHLTKLNREELSMIAIALKGLQVATPKEDLLSKLEIAQLQVKISDILLVGQL